MKTISLKKVSAVAVASLGFGLLSVVPANAVNNPAAVVSSINLTRVTASPTVGTAVAVNVGVAVPTQTLTTNFDFDLVSAITSFPAGGSVGVVAAVLTGAGAAATKLTADLAGTYVATGSTLRVVGTAGAVTANAVTSSATVGMGSYSFTPTRAGTYVLTVFKDSNQDGIIAAGDVSQTISITVVAATALAPAQSFLRMAGPGTLAIAFDTVNANYTTALDAVPRSATVGATPATRTGIAKVAVVLLNANGSAAGANHTVDCQITGSGLCVIDEDGTANVTAGVRAMSFANTAARNVVVVHLITDGTAGPGTVTIAVTDSVSSVRTVLGTRSFTSFGAATKLEVSTKNYTIGRAGFTTGLAATARVAATTVGNAAAAATVTVTSGTSTTPAFIVKATDANGNAVTTTAAPTIVSGTSSVVSGGTCALDDGAVAGISSSTNGVGFYNCDFATTATAASGAKSTLTIRVVDPAGDGTTFLTTTLDVTVGGSISTETISLAATYAAGEGMTIIRSAKDSAGNPVFDGAAAPALTFSKAVGGTAPGASFYVGGTRSSTSSAGIASVFAPSVPGAFTVNATSGNSAGSALTASSSVTDASTAASTAVNTRIDSLNAKIVALTALIAKIMKSLKIK